jgi:hypothetical protein
MAEETDANPGSANLLACHLINVAERLIPVGFDRGEDAFAGRRAKL